MTTNSNKKTHIFLILSITFFLLFYLCVIKIEDFCLLNLYSPNDSYMDYLFNKGFLHDNDIYSTLHGPFEKSFAIPESAFLIGGNDFLNFLVNLLIYLWSIFTPSLIKLTFCILGFIFLILTLKTFKDKKKLVFFILSLIALVLYFLLPLISFVEGQLSNIGSTTFHTILFYLSTLISFGFEISIIALLATVYIYVFLKLGIKQQISLIILVAVALSLPSILGNLYLLTYNTSLRIDMTGTFYFVSLFPSKLLYFIFFACLLISRIIEAFNIIVGMISILVVFIDLCKKHLTKKDIIICILSILFYLTFVTLTIMLYIIPFIGIQIYLSLQSLNYNDINVGAILFATALISFIYLTIISIVILCFSLFVLIICTIKYKKKWFIILYISLYLIFSNIIFFFICTLIALLIFILFSVI